MALDPRIEPRFADKYIPEPMSGCWLWLAALQRGYGVFKIGGKYHPAHRVSFELAGRDIGDGMVLDHLCRNPACVNPDHLEAVTIGENVRRGENHYRGVTHCKRGHEFTNSNTLTLSTGSRACRQCARERMARFKAKGAN